MCEIIGGGINRLNARGVGFIRGLYECGPPSLSVSLLKSDSKLFIKLCPTLWHIEIVCDFKKDWNSVNNIPKKSGLLTKEWNITEMLVTEHYKQLHVFVLLTLISSNNLLNKLRGVLKVDSLEHFGGRSIWSVFMDVYLIYILVMHIVRGCLRPKPLGSIL